jgi:hypothetical protein
MGSIEDFFDATGPGPTGFLTVFDAVNDPSTLRLRWGHEWQHHWAVGILRQPRAEPTEQLFAARGFMGAARPGAR